MLLQWRNVAIGIYIDPSFVQRAIQEEGFFDEYFSTSAANNYRTNIVQVSNVLLLYNVLQLYHTFF
jgi:hypothetical protein